MKCPSCNASINADFGMISCPKCDAVFMVEMDGTIREAQDHEPLEEQFGNEAVSEVEESESFVSEEIPEMSMPLTGEDPVPIPDPFPSPMEEETLDEGAEEVQWATSEESDVAEEESPYANAEEESSAASEDDEYSENFMGQMDQPAEPEGIESPEDPLGVTAFDQSPQSQMPDGLYYYDMKITGLDSPLVRQSVVDHLSDPRFEWLPEDIKKQIANGELILRNLNPVKAVLAAIKLQTLDVEIEWDQKLYTDVKEPEAEGEL